MEKVHNMRTTATQKNREVQGVPEHLNRTPKQKVPEEFHESSSSRQSQDQVPRTCNKQTCYDPQLQGFSYGIAIFLMTLGSSIIGSSSYLSSNQMHDVPRHPKNIPRHPKRSKTSQKQNSEKLSTRWTAKTWQLWKLLHKSSNESTCVQLHVQDIKLVGTRPLSGRGVFLINGVSWLMFDVAVPIGFWLMWFQRRKTPDSGA